MGSGQQYAESLDCNFVFKFTIDCLCDFMKMGFAFFVFLCKFTRTILWKIIIEIFYVEKINKAVAQISDLKFVTLSIYNLT